MHQWTEDVIKIGIESEIEDGMNRERDTGMRESTAKRQKEKTDGGMDQAKHAEIKEGVEERAKEKRTETIGVKFRTGDLISYCSVFSFMEVPCAIIYSVHPGRIIVIDQHSEKMYNCIRKNARRSSDQPHEI
jgi:hypothetical protein